MSFTIYHNPNCSNSRRALEIVEAAGIAPAVVEYLKTPLAKAELKALIAKMGIGVRAAMRMKEPLYAELTLETADDDALLDAIAANPILLNRPIVVTAKGAKLCRPADLVRELL
jgi:arsenate reductase (glutaredoxin)